MTEFDVCLGTGDYSTGIESDDVDYDKYPRSLEPPREGLIMDSTGHWYDPTNYIDCLYADW